MGMQLKRNSIDARYLRARTAPRTRLERTSPMPAHDRQIRKTVSNGVLSMSMIAILVVAIAGISILPALLSASPLTNAENTVQSNVTPPDTKDDNARLQQLLDSTDSDLLTLVNKWNAISEGEGESLVAKGRNATTVTETRKANLVEIEGNHKIDVRCKDDLEAMMEACRNAGNHPMICSAYRTMAEQQELFDAEVKQYRQMGYSEKYAVKRAGKSVAAPGTSEHHLGLAIDVVDELNQRLDSTQITSDTQTWMMKNSWRYGFILRYPSGKEDVTGIVFEPWHYRYLTRDVAREVHESGLCYEEFLKKVGR